MPSKRNLEGVKTLQEKFDQAKSAVLVNYEGTSVNDQVELRSALTVVGGEMFVTKNTLIDHALGKGKWTDSLKGMNAIVFSYQDAIAAIKALFQFHEDREKLEIKQGVMADKILSAEEIEALSKLPSRQELMSMLVMRLKGPLYGLTNVFKAGPRDLVYALRAIRDNKSESAV